jgi:adenylosuccinate lyase
LQLFPSEEASAKVKELDNLVTKSAGFEKKFIISGQVIISFFRCNFEVNVASNIFLQTYSRKCDTTIVSALASLGATATKICTDIRLLAHDKEIEEPFESNQIGKCFPHTKRNS